MIKGVRASQSSLWRQEEQVSELGISQVVFPFRGDHKAGVWGVCLWWYFFMLCRGLGQEIVQKSFKLVLWPDAQWATSLKYQVPG